MDNHDYLSRASHTDYIASTFLKEECGLRNLKFSTREVKMSNGAKVRLLHIEGIAGNGRIADNDFWPSRCQTEADLEKMPENLEDVRLRFGFYIEETTGEIYPGKRPTFLGYYLNGEFISFSGPKPTWSEDSQCLVWTNDEQSK